ncbi:MAG: RNA polymerase sigma factor [Velocimicrobium sp.]
MDIIEIYKEYYDKVYNYALRLSCHPEDAEDIAQETFLSALTKLYMVKNKEAIFSWLRTICYHKFIDHARKNKYLTEVDDWQQLENEGKYLYSNQPLPDLEVVVSEEIRDMQNGCFLAMVRKLTLNQRIAFSLTDMYGMNIDGVADILQISVQAAKGLLYRARMNIDAFFSDHCSILNEKNPCSCKAWLEFSTRRNDLQEKSKKIISQLDYKKKGYIFDEEVRRKIYKLYRNIPDRKPSDDWYKKVLIILQENK